MSLESINTSPTYTMTIPSTGKQVDYRPYNVGEQKNLLLAKMEDDTQTILTAAKVMIENCTFKKVQFDSSPAFDIEYIMVKLRSKSAGEIVDVGVVCTKCEHQFPYQINLEEVKVTKEPNRNLKLSESLHFVMSYPTVKTAVDFDPTNVDSAFAQIAACVETIVDGDEVYDAKDQTQESIVKLIERLTESQVQLIKDFFVNLPQVEYKATQACPSCDHVNNIHVTGITNFFI